MLVVNSREPQMEVDACRACNAVWFDKPTYESLPELSFVATSSLAMQATEIIAMERLEELRKRLEEERKGVRKKKLLHRVRKAGIDDAGENPAIKEP